MKKFLSLMMAVLLVALSVVPVMAEPTTPPAAGDDSQYALVAGETINFTKYLISEMGQTIPDLTFKYEITAGTARPAVTATPAQAEKWTFENQNYPTEQDARDAVAAWNADPANVSNQKTFDADVTHTAAQDAVEGEFEVFAGIDPDKVTVGYAEFVDADTKYADVATGDTVVLEDGEVYQKENVAINFSQVKFPEPGIYRYIITEKVIADAVGITYDTQRGAEATERVRVIDVYVVEKDDGSNTLVIDNTTVMHEVATKIKTTDELGSKDEKATEATRWIIVGVPADYQTVTGYTDAGYDSYDAANAVRIAIREKIHDDILVENNKIAALAAEVTAKQADLTAAEQAAGILALETAYNNAVTERETRETQLTTLQSQLAATTDPAQITAIRGQIDTLKATGNPAPQGSVQEAQEAETAAKDALDTARGTVAAAQQAYDDAVAAQTAQEAKVAALQALYNTLGTDSIVEVEWKLTDKSDNFVNEIAPLYDLQFHKKVTGNQGSRDKYFEFTLTIEGLTAGQLVTIDSNSVFTKEPTKTTATKYDADAMKAANSVDDNAKWMYGDQEYEDQAAAETAAKGDIDTTTTPGKFIFDGEEYDTLPEAEAAAVAACVAPLPGQQLKANATGKITQKFYLKDGEFIKVLDITKNATYSVTEVEEDYKKAEFTDKKAYAGTDPEMVAIDNAILAAAGNQALIDELTAKKDELDAKKHNDPTSGTLDGNKFTGYTNTRQGVIPTGVAVGVAGGVILIAVAAVYVVLRRKLATEDEYYED